MIRRQLAQFGRVPTIARILIAMVAGGLVGSWLGPSAAPLERFGTVLIGLIKGLAGPLLFFAVVDAFLRTEIERRSGLILVAIAAVNASIALLIGLTLSNVLRPGDWIALPSGPTIRPPATGRSIDFVRELTGLIPTSAVRPFLDNEIVPIVILAVLAGLGLRRVKNERRGQGMAGLPAVEEAAEACFRAVEIVLSWVVRLVPLAVFGVVAKTIGQQGLRPIVGLSAYVGVVMLGLAIQVLVVYQAWMILVARMSLRRFWAGAREPVAYALGSSSSLATLPVTLRALKVMGVSDRSARLAACVGTNLNNDGILLYEAIAVLMVAQISGQHLSIGQQGLVAAACAIAGVGIAGVPDAGLISLALVLTTVGLPIEILPILLTVDWLLSRCRAMTNVAGDMVVAILLDRFAPKEQRKSGLEPG